MVHEHPWATTEASNSSRLPQSAAANGRLFLPAAARRLWLEAHLGWAGAAPSPHTGSSGGDIAVELLLISDVVWLVVNFRGAGRRKTGLEAVSIVFETSEAV